MGGGGPGWRSSQSMLCFQAAPTATSNRQRQLHAAAVAPCSPVRWLASKTEQLPVSMRTRRAQPLQPCPPVNSSASRFSTRAVSMTANPFSSQYLQCSRGREDDRKLSTPRMNGGPKPARLSGGVAPPRHQSACRRPGRNMGQVVDCWQHRPMRCRHLPSCGHSQGLMAAYL